LISTKGSIREASLLITQTLRRVAVVVVHFRLSQLTWFGAEEVQWRRKKYSSSVLVMMASRA